MPFHAKRVENRHSKVTVSLAMGVPNVCLKSAEFFTAGHDWFHE